MIGMQRGQAANAEEGVLWRHVFPQTIARDCGDFLQMSGAGASASASDGAQNQSCSWQNRVQ